MSLLQELIDYSNDIINGDIIACQKHKWACQRFLNDLDRQGNEDFPYIFDENKALKFLYWMTLFKHKKGTLAGQNINPHIIQRFMFGNVYGWIHKDGFRRFKYFTWFTAKKQAKSQSLSIMALYELMALGEHGAEVYCGATKTKQAKIVWEEARWMLENCPDLRGKFKISNGQILHPKSASKFEYLSKEDGKSGDGIACHFGIIDELHLHPTMEMYDNLDSSTIGRNQSLIASISTAGRDLNRPAYTVEYKYVSEILDPNNPIENDKYFCMVNELDHIDEVHDISMWGKSNPIVFDYEKGREELVDKYNKAKDSPEKMVEFIIKNMSMWYHAKESGYMELSKWKECEASKENPFPDLKGKEIYIGVDLASTLDLCSVSFLIPLNDGRIAIKQHSFIPESRLLEKIKNDKQPYQSWVNKGWISEIEGDVIDDRNVIGYIKKEIKKNEWIPLEVAYDDWSARQFGNIMQEEGFTMVNIPQNTSTLFEPTKVFRNFVYQKKVVYEKDDVLTYAVSNAVTKMDDNERFKLIKKSKNKERIDPLIATIIGYARAMYHDYNQTVDLNAMINDDFLDKLGW